MRDAGGVGAAEGADDVREGGLEVLEKLNGGLGDGADFDGPVEIQ